MPDDPAEHKDVEPTFSVDELGFRQIVECISQVFYVTDSARRILYASPAFERLWGHSVELLYRGPLSWLDLVHPEDRERVADAIKQKSGSGQYEFEYRFTTADGAVRWVMSQSTEIYAPDGSLHRVVGVATDITQRQELEVALRSSETRYRRIVETAEEGIWMLDGEARTAFVNPKMAHMLGYSVEEMQGRALHDFMDETGRASAEQYLGRRRLGIAEQHEFRFVRKDGSELWALLATNPIQDPGGTYAGALAMVTDVTERRREVAALRAAEARFRSLFEHSPNCLWEEDLSEVKRRFDELRAAGVADIRAHLKHHPEEIALCLSKVKVLDVNQAALQHYQAATKAELFEGLERILTAESLEVLTQELIALAEGQTVFESEAVDQTFTGKRNHILLKVLVAPGAEATLSKVYVSIVDITARKLAEEKVRKLASFPQLNPNPVLEFSADGALLYANPACEAMAQHLGATTLAKLLPPDTTAILRDCLVKARPRLGIETRHGSHTLAWSFYPITSQQTVHCYADDITEHLELEAQLRQSQKMDAVGHLAGGIAHDFNNVLTVIQGNTALLQAEGVSAQQRAEAIDHIALATERAAGLTRQLLAFSRRQVLQPRQLDVNEVVASLAKLLQRVLNANVALKLDLHPRALLVRADPGMLDQVLMNLVVNARDAMPAGGQIVIETSDSHIGERGDLAGRDARARPNVCLRVSDTGSGIAPEDLSHIFEPFFTTKESGKGTGLGLSTAFGIVKQHGGSLSGICQRA